MVVLAIVTVMTAAACGGSTDSDDPAGGAAESDGSIQTGLVNQGPEVEPVQGGSVTMATYSEAASLDPAVSLGAGTAGGTELDAIFDVLMRYDQETQTFEPQLAESLETEDDGQTWTLTLPEGVQFTDGTAFDSAAVVASLERYVDKRGRRASLVQEMVASMDAPDARTVVFSLTKPWVDFPWLLADTPGNIVSPTAAQQLGDEFARQPVGAGPFVLKRFAPGEEIRLEANEGYWDGRPYLDELRFVTLGGAQANLEGFNVGQVQVAFLRDPEVYRQAVAAGLRGYVSVSNVGGLLLINNGVKGQTDRAGADVRVRQAIAHAVDPVLIDQRAYGAAGLPGSEIFQSTSRWGTETAGPEFDQDKAKELLAEAKADGYDGTLTLVTNNTPASTDSALAMQAMLNSVGFEVTLDGGNTVQEHIRKVISGEYDIATYGQSILDEAAWAALSTTFASDSSGNLAGYASPEMDALLDELSAATDDEAKQEVLEQIQQLMTEDVPSLPYIAMPEFVVWTDDVHGIVPTTAAKMLFAKAFIEQD